MKPIKIISTLFLFCTLIISTAHLGFNYIFIEKLEMYKGYYQDDKTAIENGTIKKESKQKYKNDVILDQVISDHQEYIKSQ